MTLLQDNMQQILGTNYRWRWREFNIIAREGDEIVSAEVPTRRGPKDGGPEESLTEAKAQHRIGPYQHFLQTHDLQTCNWEIDLVCIRIKKDYQLERIEQLKHAVHV